MNLRSWEEAQPCQHGDLVFISRHSGTCLQSHHSSSERERAGCLEIAGHQSSLLGKFSAREIRPDTVVRAFNPAKVIPGLRTYMPSSLLNLTEQPESHLYKLQILCGELSSIQLGTFLNKQYIHILWNPLLCGRSLAVIFNVVPFFSQRPSVSNHIQH